MASITRYRTSAQPNPVRHASETQEDQEIVVSPTNRFKNLPVFQLLVICFIRLCEPISFTTIAPMVPFMIAQFKPSLSEKQIGFYSGALDSTFSLCQFLTIIVWGKISDRIGRKPVLIIGLIGVCLSTIGFGFSKGVQGMLINRAIGGLLNGNIAVIKSAIGEIATSENQALAFSFIHISFSVGSVLGGYLSQPANRFPHSWFAHATFWKEYPWLLPCVVSAMVTALGVLVTLICLEETLISKKARHSEREPLLHRIPDDVQEGCDQNYEVESPLKSQVSISGLLKDRNLVAILSNYSLLSFQTIALDALILLFAYTPIRSGGIGFSASNIGLALSLSGILSLLAQFGFFVPLQKRYGTIKLYRLCMSSYPIIFWLFPVVHLVARAETHSKNSTHIGAWIGFSIILFLKCTANIVFSCNMILVNSAAPTQDALGTINGLAQSCASFVRAVGPITASNLFALSVLHQSFLDGNGVFVLFGAICIASSLNSFTIKDGATLDCPTLRRLGVKKNTSSYQLEKGLLSRHIHL
ncbi:hypothetical protein O181_004350 [Austropuccinia psidii MF-1]|uniref:Major facilitator superfamily (MFS) profile domain-containing protein n=1 Tax=Austropuccinia psidii MF-1 TaxID=1389203 RepID=A0A9Q3GES4_9BASI|nr:hypothetical protein [Austropuccinia psidii MF-1]